jgi:hypothetical protein
MNIGAVEKVLGEGVAALTSVQFSASRGMTLTKWRYAVLGIKAAKIAGAND